MRRGGLALAASQRALRLQALANSTLEYESLEAEVSALHDELWEQLSLDLQVKGLPGRRGPCPLVQERPWRLPFML